jgi:hypothetical protein
MQLLVCRCPCFLLIPKLKNTCLFGGTCGTWNTPRGRIAECLVCKGRWYWEHNLCSTEILFFMRWRFASSLVYKVPVFFVLSGGISCPLFRPLQMIVSPDLPNTLFPFHSVLHNLRICYSVDKWTSEPIARPYRRTVKPRFTISRSQYCGRGCWSWHSGCCTSKDGALGTQWQRG